MVTLTHPTQLAPYLADASNLSGGFAEGAALPTSEREVSDFLREACRTRTPVTVAGYGCGLVGGRIPFGGWVLSTERLNAIAAIRRAPDGAWVALVQPGVPLSRLQEAAQDHGLFYPPDPTEGQAFVGGTISTNASGARSFRYGTTRRHVRALRLVLPSGETLALRRGRFRARGERLDLETEQGRRITVPLPRYRMPATKHAAGYFAKPGLDAVDLFIGAEGTLGVVTQAELALLPMPEAVVSFVAFFPSEERAWRAAIHIRALSKRRSGRLHARAIEYLDARSLALLRPGSPQLPVRARAALYVEQETTASAAGTALSRWSRRVAACGGLRDAWWTATNPEERRALNALRRALPLAVNEQRRRAGQPKIGTDMAVPDGRLLELLRAYRRTLDRLGQPYCVFGHIGDNHLHANIMPRTPAELTQAREAYARLVAKAIALGGTLSAEHGVGKLKRAFLGWLFSEGDLAQMRRVKEALDPHWLLGQGNIFER